MDRQLGTGNEPGIEKEGVGNAISFELVQLFDERACRNPTQLVRSLMRYIKVTKWKMKPLLFELLQMIFARLWKHTDAGLTCSTNSMTY